MKRMYWIANCLLLIGMLQTGCQDRTVGFLDIRHAAYAPDSMIVKAGLDPDDDAYQIKFKNTLAIRGDGGSGGNKPGEVHDSECPGVNTPKLLHNFECLGVDE